MDCIIRRFDDPDELRSFDKGSFELVRVGGTTVGRATYEPGWIWSEHVGSETGEKWCEVEHVGIVLEGSAAVRMRDGEELTLQAGDVFYIPPGHDSWVVGDTRYRSLHLAGGEEYAQSED